MSPLTHRQPDRRPHMPQRSRLAAFTIAVSLAGVIFVPPTYVVAKEGVSRTAAANVPPANDGLPVPGFEIADHRDGAQGSVHAIRPASQGA